MNKVLFFYLVTTAVLWLPCVASIRQVVGGGHRQHLVAGFVVALGWPVSAPVLGWLRLPHMAVAALRTRTVIRKR